MDMRTKDIEKLSGKVEGPSRLQDGEARENNCAKIDARLDMAYRGIAAPGTGRYRMGTPWR